MLFADVVHSMDIAAAVGAERLREIMTELFDRSSAVVRRYGGTVDKFTGDGLMAVFGAPVALEDHALRACLAALDIHREVDRLSGEVRERDGVELRLRVGLNSGQVIAGEIGSGPMSYTTIGEQVGMAQRMESVAPPGGVMLSESTARLVGDVVTLGEPESVRIKGARRAGERPPTACGRPRRVGSGPDRCRLWWGATGSSSTIEAMLDQSTKGKGRIVGLVGPPGIGKSRMAGEIAALAASGPSRCSRRSANRIPAGSRSMRLRVSCATSSRSTGLDRRRRAGDRSGAAARPQMPKTSLLLYDLLGIRDRRHPVARHRSRCARRRLTALLNAAAVARTTPAVYVIEDVHWIDEVSEAMIAAVRRRGSADALADARHVPAGIPRGARHAAQLAPHCACAAG